MLFQNLLTIVFLNLIKYNLNIAIDTCIKKYKISNNYNKDKA